MKTKGFIDLHTHGIGRCDTRTGDHEDILKMAELYGRKGTSAILPTIYPASINVMRKNMEAVRRAREMQDSEYRMHPPQSPLNKGGIKGGYCASCIMRHASCILGVHLEGPFLNPLRCGALNKNSFIMPSVSSLRRLVDGYEDFVKIITIAPEMKGALKVIERCAAIGIKVNMGHSDATCNEAIDGKKAGATGITHIFNAMRPFHHREPGLAGFGLIDENLYVEVIADGIHLHPKTIELVFATKRLDRIIIVSDSVKSNPPIPPLAKGGKGGFSGKKGMPIYNEKGILAGNGMTISDTVKALKGIGIPEAEIIEAAVDNPRRYIGIV